MKATPRGALIVFLSFLWFFLILGGYFVIRPVRETMGVTSGSDSLNLLFLGTFIAMSLAIPVYSALVAKLPRRPWSTLCIDSSPSISSDSGTYCNWSHLKFDYG